MPIWRVNFTCKFPRDALKGEKLRIVDDLTKVDLEEKQKWKEEVKELYNKGI